MANLHTASKNQVELISHLKEMASYFPIGESVDYYPEFQTTMTMRSIILGYEINGHIIYAQNQLEIITSSKGNAFITLHVDDKEYEFSDIHSFCIMLPGKAGEEYKLNFLNKASLGSRGQFRNGNAITLVTRHHSRGMVMLETQVSESMIPKTGYYRNHQLVLLDARLSNLEYSEQRTHHRLETRVPVNVQIESNMRSYDCILANYSELHLQIRFNADEDLAKLVKTGERIILTLKMDYLHKTFIVSGTIMRKSKDSAIFTMQEIFDDGHPRHFGLMDALDIKACLLQHPSTR